MRTLPNSLVSTLVLGPAILTTAPVPVPPLWPASPRRYRTATCCSAPSARPRKPCWSAPSAAKRLRPS